MKMSRIHKLLIVVAVVTAIGTHATVADAARICIQAGDYVYDINYVPQEDTFDLHGHIAGHPTTFAGTARVVAGQLLIGLTTVWPWGSGSYQDPTSVVWMNANTGTYDTTYIPANRNFKGSFAIVGCYATPLRPQTGQETENSKP